MIWVPLAHCELSNDYQYESSFAHTHTCSHTHTHTHTHIHTHTQVHSFRNLTKAEAVYKLKHYFKFAIVRNPAERLLSAYRNKLESPFIARKLIM